MKPPTDPPPPTPPGDKTERPDQASARPAQPAAPRAAGDEQPPDQGAVRRPGKHGGYRIGGEPAIGHRWHEAPPPPPATMTPFDDGVPHRHREPGEEDPLHNQDVDHEHRDVDIRTLIASAVALAVVVGISMVLMWLLFGFFERQAAANDPQVSPLALPSADMPKSTTESPFFNPNVGGPQLMTNEPMALAKQRDEAQKRLQGYGWVNQAGGVAHMPIEEAKKLIRERGLPVRQDEAVPPTLGTRLPAGGEASGGRIITAPPAAAAPAAAPAQGGKPHGETPAAKPHAPGGH